MRYVLGALMALTLLLIIVSVATVLPAFFGGMGDSAWDEEGPGPLLHDILGDEYGRLSALSPWREVLVQDRSAVPLLAREYRDNPPDEKVRAAAVFALGHLAGGTRRGALARQIARDALLDPSPLVRREAADAEGLLGDTDSIPRLAQMAADQEEKSTVRDGAIGGLTNMGTDAACRQLEALAANAPDSDRESIRSCVMICRLSQRLNAALWQVPVLWLLLTGEALAMIPSVRRFQARRA